MTDETSFLPPGTLCVLVNMRDFPELNDRVVETTNGPIRDHEGVWYEVDARWVRARWPDTPARALRRCLRPIVPGAGLPAELATLEAER